jgi:imidazolonepropionase-like amidohydrolase
MAAGGLKLAAALKKAGVKYAVCTDHPVVPVQFLGLSAALTVREGVSKLDALKSITADAADILGLSDRIGRIAPGLDADFAVVKGGFTDVTAAVSAVFIHGERV